MRIPRGQFMCAGFMAIAAVILTGATGYVAARPRPANPPMPEAVASRSSEAALGGTTRMTREDVEAFLDGIMSQRLERDNIAGAVVAVVKDGEVLLEKGYGYADVGKRAPVSADRTLFGIGSISKTFVGTAIMQLLEQGRLDLDADVQSYLDFPLRKTFPDAITLRQLLTHRAGFEENGKDYYDSITAPSKLGEFVHTHQPRQLFRPGTRVAYSNYGVSLAGYIVERVSGESFTDYIARHIYQPLGMEHSSFAVPLPANLEPLASKEYWLASEPPRALEYLTRRPAGGMFSTADDMAHYMVAHLQDGRYGEQRILKEATAQAMQTIQWRGNPDAPGIAIVFYQDVGNGRFVLEHGGDLACQHSQLWLVPSERLGVFVAFNSTGTDWTRLRAYIWKSLIDRYFPAPAVAEPASETAHQDAQAVAGTYLTTRRFETNFLAITSYLAPTRVIVNPDDTISINGADRYDGRPRTFRSAGKLLFRETGDTGHTIAFLRGENGKVGLMIADSIAEFERETALFDGHTQAVLLMMAAGVLALSVVLWPVTVLARRRFARPLNAELDVLARRRRLIVKSVTAAALGLIALATLYLLKFAKLELWILSSRLDPLVRFFQLLAVLVMVGTVYTVWVAYIAWRAREGSVLHRIGVTLVGLSLLVLSAFLASYHFLTFDLAY